MKTADVATIVAEVIRQLGVVKTPLASVNAESELPRSSETGREDNSGRNGVAKIQAAVTRKFKSLTMSNARHYQALSVLKERDNLNEGEVVDVMNHIGARIDHLAELHQGWLERLGVQGKAIRKTGRGGQGNASKKRGTEVEVAGMRALKKMGLAVGGTAESASSSTKPTIEDFTLLAIEKLAEDGFQTIHTVISGFNYAWRLLQIDPDPVAAILKLAKDGKIDYRQAKKGALIGKPGSIRNKVIPTDEEIQGVIAKLGSRTKH